MSIPCQQVEKITRLDITQQQMVKDISEIKESVKETNEKLDTLIDKFDSKYATKSSVNRIRVIIRSVIGFGAVAVAKYLFKL